MNDESVELTRDNVMALISLESLESCDTIKEMKIKFRQMIHLVKGQQFDARKKLEKALEKSGR